MRKFMTMMVVALLSIGVVSAQTRKISGRVTDSKGTPVPGATVKTKNGTAVAADENGFYTIDVQNGDVLTITSIDFGTSTAKVGTGATLDISLTSKENKLEEVVVTAQGVRKRPKELGYSVAKVTTAELTNGRSPQLAAGLSGKVSGLAVFNVNNSVDPSVKISLRGYRSLTGNNDALIVLDGLPLPKESSTMLNLLNPNDIESVSVLKGGVAATLYGSDGVNGALVITTKRGTKGKARVTYTHSSNID
ncbi:MAG: TonB-dependent receptor plug domain-containing protein, partial [Bacteroidota bacterium]